MRTDAELLPRGEQLVRAFRWIRERTGDRGVTMSQLIEEAALQFDLSPNDTEVLWHALTPKTKKTLRLGYSSRVPTQPRGDR
jgi:hypothetical protein